jgi:hypothetical protein
MHMKFKPKNTKKGGRLGDAGINDRIILFVAVSKKNVQRRMTE